MVAFDSEVAAIRAGVAHHGAPLRGWRCVRFVHCTSFLVATIEHESRLYLTENWQHRYLRGLGFTLLSLALGPWGIPWGLWLTAKSVWTNLSGGLDVTEEVLAR